MGTLPGGHIASLLCVFPPLFFLPIVLAQRFRVRDSLAPFARRSAHSDTKKRLCHWLERKACLKSYVKKRRRGGQIRLLWRFGGVLCCFRMSDRIFFLGCCCKPLIGRRVATMRLSTRKKQGQREREPCEVWVHYDADHCHPLLPTFVDARTNPTRTYRGTEKKENIRDGPEFPNSHTGAKENHKKSNGRPKSVCTPPFCLLKNCSRHMRHETCLLSALLLVPKQTKERAVDTFGAVR